MPLKRDTLSTINERLINGLDSRLPDGRPRLRRSLSAVIAKIVAGAAHLLYGYIDYKAQQIIPETADEENFTLMASRKGIIRKIAEAASGSIVVSGDIGSVMLSGSEWQRDDGISYLTAEEITFTANDMTVSVVAVTTGQETNAITGTTLRLVTTLPGIDSTAEVDTDGLTGGVDIEPLANWKARYLRRIRRPAQGGAKHDYENWALEVAGVTRAWCSPQETAINSVIVRFIRDYDTDPIPAAAEILAVKNYIETKAPVGADVIVLAPIPVPIDFQISVTPATASVKAAIHAELDDLFLREAIPQSDAGNYSGTVLISHIREALSIAAGENDHVLTSPTENITVENGEMAVMGAITWG